MHPFAFSRAAAGLLALVTSCSRAATGRGDQVPSETVNPAVPIENADDARREASLPHIALAPSASAPASDHEDGDEAFVDLSDLDATVLLDMRYASTRNFTGTVIYPSSRCLLRAPVAQALLRVQDKLHDDQLQLLIWDCYRPFSVQEEFWRIIPDARYVAKPERRAGQPFKGSKHNRGAAIDLTLADRDGKPLEMPTDHDDFSKRAHRDAQGVSLRARRNAALLDAAMRAEGFAGIDTEWWHFDHEDWQGYSLSEQPLSSP